MHLQMPAYTPELVSQNEYLRWESAVHTPQVASIDSLQGGSDLPLPLQNYSAAAALPMPYLGAPASAGEPRGPRPASPGTVEKMASLLRSLSFAASRPHVGDAAELTATYKSIAATLTTELRGDEFGRLETRVPELSKPLHTALIASCGALLGVQHADAALEWATQQTEQLSVSLPEEASFPGTYYHQIFASDVSQLQSSLAMARREIGRRRDLAADVLDVISRPGAAVAELTSVGKAAHEAALPREAAAANAVAELSERESVTRVRLETVEGVRARVTPM